MPELPEVETACQGIAPHILDQTVTDVIVRNFSLRWPIPKQLKKYLVGQIIQKVNRRGKYILITTEKGTLILHLGMSGSVRIVLHAHPLKKHDHVDILFANGHAIRFTDQRRFGAVLWTKTDPYKHVLLKDLGPEPLSEDFSADYLYEVCQKRKQAIKTLVMDGHIVVGVGNIYANEALFRSHIHPQLAAKELTQRECVKLVKAIKQVLIEAIKQGGTTLRNFFHSQADGKPGYFKQKLRVYGRGGMPCIRCKTELTEIRLGQRTTVFCGKCQLLKNASLLST